MKKKNRNSTKGRLATVLTAFAITLLVAGCSSSGSSPTDPSGGFQPSDGEVETQSHRMLNTERDRNELRALELDEKLSRIARQHSQNMRDQGFFSHVDPRGFDYSDRVSAAGVSYVAVAENLAKIQGSPDPAGMAHNQFMNSPTHRRNILDGRFNAVGIGVASDGKTYWITQLFIQE